MKYRMEITIAGGTKQDGGDFILRETKKTLTFECVRYPFFSAYNQMIDKKKIAENIYKAKPLRISKYYPDGKPAWRDVDHGHATSKSYMNNGHVARFWDDGSITVYPNQCGIPHHLEPIL